MTRSLKGLIFALMLSVFFGIDAHAANAAAQETAQARDMESKAPSTADGQPVPRDAETVWIGLPLVNSDGKTIGTVAGILRDNEGIVREVTAETGGVMGFFTRRRAIPVERIVPEEKRIVVPMTDQEIEEMPEPGDAARQ
ncbi:PRC-barrel domain-containing protein [Rhizobiales bacterium]|uniref:PRC-barrel domain-containing protein n=1 Tax=Hongsoonwoonella zoysiae TaxID=2821844 RepID=UPI0015612657|nr:PRC-barrel domain-containing protein [Hongsoonwoonella zoysiae]NRG16514.1 PRC-barrel domain-containing protein [Hongsoonwoonella zoysiae]